MEPAVATIIVGILQLVGVCAASLAVDRLGRRVLLVASYSSMCACLAVLGGCFFMKVSVRSAETTGKG